MITYRAAGASREPITTALAIRSSGAPTSLRLRLCGIGASGVRRSTRSRRSRLALAGRGCRRAANLAGARTAGAGTTGSLGGAAGINGWAGSNIVGHGGVDVDADAGVSRAVRAGDLDGGRVGIAATRDGDLVAADVELGTAGLTRRVEGEGLGAEEIVSRLDVRGDLDVHLAAALVQIASAPVVVVAHGAARLLGPPVGEDLEPAGRAVRLGGVGDLGEVDLHGSPVGAANGLVVARPVTRLLVHLDGDRSSCRDAAHTGYGPGPGVAGEVPAVYICDGRV